MSDRHALLALLTGLVTVISACNRSVKPSPGREKEAELCAKTVAFERENQTGRWVNRNEGGAHIEGCFLKDGEPLKIEESNNPAFYFQAFYSQSGHSLVRRYNSADGAVGAVTRFMPDGRKFESKLDSDHVVREPVVERSASGAVLSVKCYSAAEFSSIEPFAIELHYSYADGEFRLTKDCKTDAGCTCPTWSGKLRYPDAAEATVAASPAPTVGAVADDTKQQTARFVECVAVCNKARSKDDIAKEVSVR